MNTIQTRSGRRRRHSVLEFLTRLLPWMTSGSRSGDVIRPPRRPSRAGRSAALVVALGAVLAVSAATAAPASASGYTCAFGANITVFNLPTIPTVEFCNGVNGKGTYVGNTYGSFLSAGVICNYSMTSEFFDARSRWYRTFSSGTHWGCSFPGWGSETLRIYPGYTAQRGFVCNTLRSNGSRVTSSCISIY